MAIIILSFFLWQESTLNFSERYVSSERSALVIASVIFVLLALDVVLPTPSSLLSLSAALYFGFLAGSLIIFVGMSCCCLLGYYLGNSANTLTKGQLLDVDAKRSVTTKQWMRRWGLWSLVLARPVPVIAETSVIMAGMAQIPMTTFLKYTLPANAVIALIYGLAALYDFNLFR